MSVLSETSPLAASSDLHIDTIMASIISLALETVASSIAREVTASGGCSIFRNILDSCIHCHPCVTTLFGFIVYHACIHLSPFLVITLFGCTVGKDFSRMFPIGSSYKRHYTCMAHSPLTVLPLSLSCSSFSLSAVCGLFVTCAI